MIIDSGIDCLDPIDPQAGMDLGEVKEKYGRQVALKGNVDCAQLMTFGAPEEVIEATKVALRKGMPGGGFILSSSNSIHSGVKPENYVAMMQTLNEFGGYSLEPAKLFRKIHGICISQAHEAKKFLPQRHKVAEIFLILCASVTPWPKMVVRSVSG